MADWSWKGGKPSAPNDITDTDNYIDLATDATPAGSMADSTTIYVGADMVAAMGGGALPASGITMVVQPEALYSLGTAASPLTCPGAGFTSVEAAAPVNAYLGGTATSLRVQGIGQAKVVWSSGTIGQTALEVSRGTLEIGAGVTLHGSHTLFCGPGGSVTVEAGTSNALSAEVDRDGFVRCYAAFGNVQIDGSFTTTGGAAQSSSTKATVRAGGSFMDASSGIKREVDVRPNGEYTLVGSGQAPTITLLIESDGSRVATRVAGKEATVTTRQYRYERAAAMLSANPPIGQA